MTEDIHQDQPVLEISGKLDPPRKTVILLHGRGATAQSMAPLVKELQTGEVKFLIPQAAKNRWYPQTAFGPLAANEPDLSSALSWIENILRDLVERGVDKEQVYLGGFSQGACLAAEFVARHPDRYGGLFVLSGALIGPPDQSRQIKDRVVGMPVFIGGSDRDPWVDHGLMEKTAQAFEDAGADVDFRTYPGMGHTINKDEVQAVRKMLASS